MSGLLLRLRQEHGRGGLAVNAGVLHGGALLPGGAALLDDGLGGSPPRAPAVGRAHTMALDAESTVGELVVLVLEEHVARGNRGRDGTVADGARRLADTAAGHVVADVGVADVVAMVLCAPGAEVAVALIDLVRALSDAMAAADTLGLSERHGIGRANRRKSVYYSGEPRKILSRAYNFFSPLATSFFQISLDTPDSTTHSAGELEDQHSWSRG